MKAILVLLFLVSVAFAVPQPKAVCSSENDHNLKVGCDVVGTKPPLELMRKSVVANGQLFKVQTRTAYYPETGVGQKITCIKVIDKMANNRGGCPFVINGGVGYNYVELQFVSQVSQGLNFLIEIYSESP